MTLKTRIGRLEGRRSLSVNRIDAKPELIRRINALAERMREVGAPPDQGARQRVLDYLAMKFGAMEEGESKRDWSVSNASGRHFRISNGPMNSWTGELRS